MSSLISLLRPFVSKSPALSSFYRNWRDGRALREEPKETVLGFRFNGHKAMERGVFEPTETRLISRLLPLADTVVNVGANIGYYCCLALKEGKHVVAFEPMPTNLRYLLRNVFANGWQSAFECFPMALSDKSGLIKIYGSGTGASLIKGWAGQDYATIVPVSTLDTILGDRLHSEKLLVIIDVEGVEYSVLQGAQQLLASPTPPIWFMEVVGTHHQPDGTTVNPNFYKTFKMFAEHGYTAITADNDPRIIPLSTIESDKEWPANNPLTYNFIFVENAAADMVLERLRQ